MSLKLILLSFLIITSYLQRLIESSSITILSKILRSQVEDNPVHLQRYLVFIFRDELFVHNLAVFDPVKGVLHHYPDALSFNCDF